MSESFASGIKKTFFTLIVLLSMATSFLFFVEIFSLGRGLVSDLVISTLINGAVGVLITDLAALVWLQVYLRGSDNNALRSLAVTGAGVGMVASAVASFGYLLMVGAEHYTVAAEWRSYVTWIMAAIIVTHFVLVFLSGYKATSAQIDEKFADMLAEGTKEMLTLTEQGFRDQIPHLAQQNADELKRRLAGRFASLTAHGNGADQPAPPQPTTPPALPDPGEPIEDKPRYYIKRWQRSEKFPWINDGRPVSLDDAIAEVKRYGPEKRRIVDGHNRDLTEMALNGELHEGEDQPPRSRRFRPYSTKEKNGATN